MRSPWFRRVTAGSTCGLLARDVDWEATPLGPPGTWPTSLRVAVEMCFATRFPVLVAWGPQLTMIYNDGYREMLGSDKHPSAMGSPVAEVWKEIWEDLEESVERVMVHGEPTWVVDQHLVMHRSGYDEDAYFTYSYSPIRDAAGTVGGLLDIATETTTQVVEGRRMRLLGDLSVRLAAAHGDLPEISRAATALLADSQDVAAAELHLVDPDGHLTLLGSSAPGTPGPLPEHVVARVAETDVAEERGRTLVVPLPPPATGAVVLSAAERRPWDDGYRSFLRLVASAVGVAVAGTLRHVREVDQLRAVSDTFQAAIVPEGVALPGIVARYRPAAGDLAVGGDWYDVVQITPGRHALVIGDCVGHGLDAAARMGQLRAATRSLLLQDATPATVLEGLDRFARTLPGAECTTVFCAVVDEQAGTLTYSAAGHLPPVLRRADGETRLLDGARGAALALSGRRRTQSTETLAPGDLVIAYTDGLIERRGEALPHAIDRLAGVVAAQPGHASPEDVADDLLRSFAPHGSDDDVALVVYRAVSA
ncbi:SpoIIE family protein phosphatase [Cellulomonas sp. C5510]|uniref:SpoIIE family protein phosphatase n=1 Tax=Cellulomonas sp. C5510 TaxID=2871170 RepID=UPI001C98A360|nr:SpoIIE family protein phosphatase [Cellulomonas sp. C5510]QZN84642.1 SpoIIE family protein phosphatase [Cellulomonas sp. C5510]